jgi:hypothetical protein
LLNTITLCIPLTSISAVVFAAQLPVLFRFQLPVLFVLAVAFAFLVVIPEGDLLLSLSLPS